MRKIAMMFALFLLVAMIPIAHADAEASASTSATIDDKTQAEVEATVTTHGAVMRMLQLEKALDRNIVSGQAIIDALVKANASSNASANISSMKETLEQMKVLKTQVDAAVVSKTNLTAQQFVDFKKDAIDLSAQFRAQAIAAIKASDIEGIRKKAKEAKDKEELKADIKALNEKIKSEIRAHNAERLQKMLSAMGETNETFVAKVRSGELNVGQIRAEINAQFNAMSKETRAEAMAKLKEDMTRIKVMRQAVIEQIKQNFTERKMVRVDKRLEKVIGKDAFERRTEKREEVKNGNVRTESKSMARARPGEHVSVTNESSVEVGVQ